KEIIVNTTIVNGTSYGVPAFMGAGAIFYNKDYLEEVGLTEPPSPDNLLEYAQKLAKYDANGNLIRAGQSLRLSSGGSGVGEKLWYVMEEKGGWIITDVTFGK